MRALIVLAALASPALADDKTPSFELRDRGDAVEVIAHNVKAARTAILPVRSRLEIPIVTGPLAKRVVPGDPTVKLIELDGDGTQQMLSVKLGYEKPEVKQLARYAQAIQVGDDLHVILPRKLPVDGVAPKLPEPTNMPVVAKVDTRPIEAAVAKADAVIKPAEPAKPVVEPAKPIEPAKAIDEVKPILGPTLPVAKPEAPPAPPKHEALVAKPAAEPLKQQLAAPTDDTWSKISIYAALGLAAAGAGIWLMKKKKAQLPTHSTIEVIAQRSLGGKARVVWLSAGHREMIVSVTAQQVQMLGQWDKPDAPIVDELPVDEAPADGHDIRGALLDKLDKLHEKVAEAPRRQTATLEAQRRPTGSIPAHRAPTNSQPLQRRATGTMPAQRADRLDPAQRAPTGSIPAQRAPTGSIAPQRRATGSIPVQPAEPALSPAVSGILRLRGRTNQMAAVSPDVATGDVEADELWAKEILAATGARR